MPLVDDASVDSGVTTTIQVALSLDPAGNYASLWIFNATDQDAVVQIAPQDIDGLYVTLGQLSTGSASEILWAPWLRATFESAPTSGSLIVTR